MFATDLLIATAIRSPPFIFCPRLVNTILPSKHPFFCSQISLQFPSFFTSALPLSISCFSHQTIFQTALTGETTMFCFLFNVYTIHLLYFKNPHQPFPISLFVLSAPVQPPKASSIFLYCNYLILSFPQL